MKLTPTWSAGRRAIILASVFCVGTLALTTLPVAARLLQDEARTFTIERKYEKNSIDRYRVTADTTMNGPLTGGQEVTLKAKMLLKQTVKEIKDNGNAVVASEFEEGTAELGGQEMEILSLLPKVVTQIFDKAGKVLETKAVGGQLPGGNGDISGVLGQSQTLFMPTKPVKLGDKWKIDQKSEKDKSTVTGEASVVKVEKIGDIETLLIKAVADTVIEGPAGSKNHMEGTANLDTKTGKTIKMTGKVDIQAGPGGKQKADFTFTLVQGKDAEKKEEKKADKPDKPDKN